MKCIVYARKSTVQEDKQSRSIGDQITEIHKLLERYDDVQIIETIEESMSAKQVGRPGFNRMIELLNTKKADTIVVWDIDRLARNMIDGAIIMDMLRRSIIKKIITPQMEYMPETDNLILIMKFGFAEHYVQSLSKNVKRGIYNRYKEGYFTGPAPFGYRNTERRGIKEIAPYPASIVEKMYFLAESGYSLRSIRNELQERGVSGPNSRYLSTSSIHRILTNPFYIGILEHKTTNTDDTNEIIKESVKGKHTPIIDEQLFYSVQQRLSSNCQHNKIRPYSYLFQKMIRCECGYFLRVYAKKGHIYHESKNEKCGSYFINSDGKKTKTIREDALIKALLPIFKKLEVSKERSTEVAKLIKLNVLEMTNANKNIRLEAQKKLYTLEKQLSHLTDLLTEKTISTEAYKAKETIIIDEIRFYNAQMKDICDINVKAYSSASDMFSTLLGAIKEQFETGTTDEKRATLESTVESITKSSNRFEVAFKEEILHLAEYFDVHYKNDSVELDYTTIDEINTDYFKSMYRGILARNRT